MAEKSDGEFPWRPIDKEEMTRHQALFYSQAPIEGLLPGEKARELFLRSQLPLPILSQIWNLVDIPHDNMLDVKEFLLAMHLLQSYLRGRKLPQTLPPALCLPALVEVHPPSISVREMLAYGQLFEVLDTTHMSFMDAITSRDVLVTSGLSIEQLASVWNLADVDRDSKLSLDEFGIACHIVRFIKKGGYINGPVNVQSLLPHRTLRHDLQTKKRRLADLQSRKLRLMALREKRKNQAIQETKRAHLHRERLNCLRQWHALVCEEETISIETVLHLGDQLKEEEDNVTKTEAVAQRLNEDHGYVRGETAKVIMHEQRLTQDIATLEEEADKQRKKRQRNSLIKDLDPFHQLHEERKEERMMGNKRQKKAEKQTEKHKVEIPHKIDPFDRSKVHHKALSGEELFGVNTDRDDEEDDETPWGGPVDEKLFGLTQGFEDDFVDVWAQAAQGKTPEDLLNAEENFFNCNLENEDTIFKTVPVTEDEDELWRSLSPDELALQNEQLRRLQLKLNSVQHHIEQLGPDMVVLDDQLEEGQTEAGTPARRNPIGRRRISSDGTLENVGVGASPGSTTSLFTKRAYGDVYSRTKRLQEFASRRTLSDSGKTLVGLAGGAEAPAGDITLDEKSLTLEKEETSSVDPVIGFADEGTVKKSYAPDEKHIKKSSVADEKHIKKSSTADEKPIISSAADEKHRYIISSAADEEAVKKSSAEVWSIANSNNTTDIEVTKARSDQGAKRLNVTTSDAVESKLEAVSTKKDSELTSNTPVLSVSDSDFREEEKSDAIVSPSAISSESDTQSVIPCDTVESKVVYVDKPSVQVTEESQVQSEPQVLAKVNEDEQLFIVSENEEVVEEPVVVRRQNKPSPESEQHRASLPPNFFSEHTSPVPPPRRNSPRKKVEKGRSGSFQCGPATTGRQIPLQGSSPSKLLRDRKGDERPDFTRPLYISTSPNTPVKALPPSPLNQTSSNYINPQKDSPKRPAPSPSPVSYPTSDVLVREQATSSPRSRPYSIACTDSQSILKGQFPSDKQSPIAPPRSKRKSARKPRQSSAPSNLSSESTDAANGKANNEITTDSPHPKDDLSLEDPSEMEARQRRLELERMRDNLFGYKQKTSPSPDPLDDVNSSSHSNAVVLKLGDEEDEGHKTRPPGGMRQNQVLIDVARSEYSPQRASTTVNISNNEHSVTTPEFKSRIKLSFSDDGEDFDSSYSKTVDINKSADERLDSLIKEDIKSYKTVVDLKEPESPMFKGQTGRSPKAIGDQKSRIVLDLDDHQYRPQTRDVSAFSDITADEEYMLQGRPALDSAKHIYKTDLFVSGHHDTSSSTYESTSNNEESESSTNVDISSFAKSETELSGDSDISDDEGTFQATFEPGTHQISVIDTRTMIKLDDDGDSGITLVSYNNRSHSDTFENHKVPSPRKSTGVNLSLTPVSVNMPKSFPTEPEHEMSSVPRLIKMTRSDGQPVEPMVSPKLKMEARSTVIPRESPVFTEPEFSPKRNTSEIESGSSSASPVRPDPMSYFEPEQTRPMSTPKSRDIQRPPQLISSPGFSGESPPRTREIHTIEIKDTIETHEGNVSSPRQSPAMGLRPDPMAFFDPDITKVMTSPRARELKRPAPPAPVDHDPPRRLTSPSGMRELKRPAPSPPVLDTTSPISPPIGLSPDKLTSPLTRALPYDNGLSTVAQTGTTVFHSDGLKSINTTDSSEGSGAANKNQVSGVTGEGSNLASHHRAAYDTTSSARQPSADPHLATLRLVGDTRTHAHSLSPTSITTGSAPFSSPSRAYNNSNTSTSSTPDLLAPSSAYTTSTNSGAGSAGGGGGGGSALQESMDPITGLRKTGPISAVDKAVKFVATTEPSFRVKIKDAGDEQVDGERATLIDSMRVRRKKLETWVPGDEVLSPTESPKSISEMMYEQRKQHSKRQESPPQYQSNNNNNNKTAPPDVIPTHMHRTKADIDARSINQESTKRLWEDQIASGEVAIFPRPDNRKKSISTHDVSDFKSEVESESLNLSDVKKQWELKAEEMAKDKDDKDRKISTSKSYDNLSLGNGKAVVGAKAMVSTSQSYDSLSKVSSGQRLMSSGPGEVDEIDNSEMYESAIDREIRLAEERENELRREKETRVARQQLEARVEPAAVATSYKSLPLSASTTTTTTQEQHTQIKHHHPQQQELTQQQKESIIEREIREQERREEQLRHEGKLQSPHHTNKEHEQSEYERQEKEQEKISAHESIVEREIRLQRERDQEILKLRSAVYKDKRSSTSEPDEPDSAFLPPQHVQPDTNGHSVQVAEPHHEDPEPQPVKAPTAQRTPSASAPGMTTSISYEDAISTYAHAGESMIARELREQKEREEELRRRWREELGIESPLQNSEPDTPYNMPDPVQPRFQQQRSVIKSTTDSRSRTTENGVSAVETNTQAQRKPSRVQPMPVEDDRDPYRYVPQYETPIEREIRLAREREAEFRQMKGLSAEQNMKSDEPVVLDMKPESSVVRPQILHRKGDEPVQEKATMKRLAHSRLQQEIEIERQRELDLQRLGHISTLSDDHKGDPARYVEVVAKEASPVTPTAPQPVVISPTPVEEKEHPSTLVRKVSKSPVERTGQRSLGELKIEQELREMREREEELRSLRKATSHRMAAPGEKPTSNGTVVHVSSQEQEQRSVPSNAGAPGDTLSKGPRRKTNLAAEWEKKISGSS